MKFIICHVILYLFITSTISLFVLEDNLYFFLFFFFFDIVMEFDMFLKYRKEKKLNEIEEKNFNFFKNSGISFSILFT
ncbi:MAG: hypothetical protein HW421_543 [Ignavibacteria bacterium]|nr:hypothetical protein [Ignavibacteria bacterium]